LCGSTDDDPDQARLNRLISQQLFRPLPDSEALAARDLAFVDDSSGHSVRSF
jgi:hypothetical protein